MACFYPNSPYNSEDSYFEYTKNRDGYILYDIFSNTKTVKVLPKWEPADLPFILFSLKELLTVKNTSNLQRRNFGMKGRFHFTSEVTKTMDLLEKLAVKLPLNLENPHITQETVDQIRNLETVFEEMYSVTQEFIEDNEVINNGKYIYYKSNHPELQDLIISTNNYFMKSGIYGVAIHERLREHLKNTIIYQPNIAKFDQYGVNAIVAINRLVSNFEHVYQSFEDNCNWIRQRIKRSYLFLIDDFTPIVSVLGLMEGVPTKRPIISHITKEMQKLKARFGTKRSNSWLSNPNLQSPEFVKRFDSYVNSWIEYWEQLPKPYPPEIFMYFLNFMRSGAFQALLPPPNEEGIVNLYE